MITAGKINFSSIAREMGVTPSVVSRVMRNTSTTITIGKETKKRILGLAWERGFLLTRSVGLIASDRKDIGLLYHPAATGVLERCAELGMGIFSAHYHEGKTAGIPEFLLKRKVGGVISFDCLPENIREYLVEEKIPYVAMNPHKEITNEDSILFSDYETMTELLSYLKSRGYKKYIYASVDDKTHYAQSVLQSFADFLKAESYKSQVLLADPSSETEALKSLRKLVEASVPETVFITPARMFTMKLLEFFAACGKTAPQDGGIVGHSLLADYSIPKLTAVSYPFYEMGAAAVDMLGEKWEKRLFNLPNKTIRGRLIRNQSTEPMGEPDERQ